MQYKILKILTEFAEEYNKKRLKWSDKEFEDYEYRMIGIF